MRRIAVEQGSVPGHWPDLHAGLALAPSERSPAAARKFAQIFAAAGIYINGSQPWDIHLRDHRFFHRVLAEGNLGGGESFMDGWWDVASLDEFFARVHRADLYKKVGGLDMWWLTLSSWLFNRQSTSRSKRVAEEHYDLGNDIFEAMLDRNMQYSCAYWKGAETLDQAQLNKLRLIAQKLQVAPGMTVLDMGGGFGGLARFLAAEQGCRVISYNISHEQVDYGRELCKDLPVRFEIKDYREAANEPERFDRIVSVGFCEHLGHKNFRPFFELVHHLLRDEGLFLLHTIGGNQSLSTTDSWLNKYIFPNGMIPSIAQLGSAMEGLWVVEDWHNFGPDYDKTLMAWWENFERAWPILCQKRSERFYRMWKYYLMGCAGGFRARKLQLWQIVLSKGDIPAYIPVR